MLSNSLILLLLSNSITPRRDKSILYSRVAITILLISAFIAYDGLFFLFLEKGIGIFDGLFHTTATTNIFYIFILILAIGYSLYCYVYNAKSTTNLEKESASEKSNDEEMEENSSNLVDVNNSPIQLIDQLKGYYYINPILSLSLAISIITLIIALFIFIPEEILSLANILALILFNL